MAAVSVEQFWKPYETTVKSFDEALKLITTTFRGWSEKGAEFAWRGQADASWPLHSSLYRRLRWTRGASNSAPEEKDLQKAEEEILADVHRWGLHNGSEGRLSALTQLAKLQHYQSPTRLLDISFNPFIGLWFAVEEHWDNGTDKHEDKDARLFAIDVSKRLINEDDTRRKWEDDTRRPWPRVGDHDYKGWTTTAYAWRASRLDHRISAQNGGFLLGGVPASSGPNGSVQWPKDSGSAKGNWTIDEVRQCISVPLKFHKIQPTAGPLPGNPSYTIRIAKKAKADIRKHLQKLFGYSHATIYPDYPGFALFGVQKLKTRP